MDHIIYNLVKGKPQLVNAVFVIDKFEDLDASMFSDREKDFITHEITHKAQLIPLNYFYHWNFIVLHPRKNDQVDVLERMRRTGKKLAENVDKNELDFITIVDTVQNKEHVFALLEGLILSLYRFDKYKTSKDTKKYLKRINVFSQAVKERDLEEFENIMTSVTSVRDMINEPGSNLTATRFADTIVHDAHASGLDVELYRKEDLEKLQMGGILSVNKGSTEPPVLIKLELKHPKARNMQPYVFVGKAVIYDSGGLSLKPTAKSMDYMKSDMSGGAAVAGFMCSLAKNNVPVHAIALIPATDNRVSADAYAPGDIIRMYNGKTVEVMNTDAEGRLIMADALSFADQYKPKLVTTMATLTGSASRAIGPHGIVAMGNAGEYFFDLLTNAGEKTYERIVKFPFWEEYEEMLKSDVADMKNIGGTSAGAITAGKFLERFTSYPFLHLDIAGMAFVHSPQQYIKFGARGIGVRLLHEFVKMLTK